MTSDYRFIRLVHEGEVYHPVVASTGQVLGPADVERLATTRTRRPDQCRRLEFLLLDEGEPRHNESPFQLAGATITQSAEPCGGAWGDFRWAGLPVVLLDSGISIGSIDHIELRAPGKTAGAVGHHMVATATLHDSELSALSWGAIRSGLFGGVCANISAWVDRATDRVVAAQLIEVRLGDLECSTLPTARVLRFWEARTRHDLTARGARQQVARG